MASLHHFSDRLHAAIRAKGTPALVGIDPRLKSLPAPVRDAATGPTELDRAADAFERFGKGLIDAVADLVPAVKPQSAFFEELGPPGVAALSRIIVHARAAGLIVVLDAKRGDIGSTAGAYARGLLGGAEPERPDLADALTVNPFLGADTLEPFVSVAKERGAGLYVLCKTSNPGSGAFQGVTQDGRSVTQRVAAEIDRLSQETVGEGGYGIVGAVVGATYPAELAELRAAMPSAPLLVPGYGSQGGTAADVAGAFDGAGLGALVNSSRAVNFAFAAEPYAAEFGPTRWQQASAAAARAMVDDLKAATS
ncbi:orotidine-5'-phosphate decarboxylase [Alienimonas californiensis]|uniref:Orotidine 5'-phosphate decarboxylase n=1 Tax=Alienimonas californiensis TaxID=2527989 RepID=A0A517PDY7_9PLAN|nr:orotidine-5'-phosphate decarboxylase [Alienimonas californiensis]QDT17588.1 Orotidine 5'-phosphate decarboxylase [Alienimonas californiensis]